MWSPLCSMCDYFKTAGGKKETALHRVYHGEDLIFQQGLLIGHV